MSKRTHYEIQAHKFKDFIRRNPNGDLLSHYNEWADSNNIYGKDRHMIWKIARHCRKNKVIHINKRSKDYVALSAILKIVMEADLNKLNKLMGKELT